MTHQHGWSRGGLELKLPGGDEFEELGARDLWLEQDGLAGIVDAVEGEHVLGDVDAEGYDGHGTSLFRERDENRNSIVALVADGRWPQGSGRGSPFHSFDFRTEEMNDLDQARNPVDIFRIYWAGKGRLSGAYWKYGVAGTLGIYVFAMLGSLMLLPTALKGHDSVLDSPVFRRYLLIVYLLLLAYQAIVYVLIWKNARNVSNQVWGHVAKLAVVVGALLFLVRVFEVI